VLFERNHISELDIKKNLYVSIKNNIIKNFIKFFYSYADLIIGNSKELCLDLEKLCKTNVKLLYNFYNFKEMMSNSNKKIKHNLKFRNNIILNVGRLEEQKNQIFLLKVFKQLKKKNKKYKLVIIGSGTKLKDINLYIKNNNLENHTQVIEGVKNALPYYKKSKLYISTSLYEGFPNVIIESIAMGIPVISTNYKSGIKELLLNGKGGTIFNNLNEKNFANKTIKVLDNKPDMKKKVLLAKKNLTKFDYQSGKKRFCKLMENL
jgi:glycosyltransferase involved in cell wall biosynthesis